jgi:hypothetical protein
MRQDAATFAADTFALVLGCGTFEHDGIQALPSAESQARQLTKLLTSPKGVALLPEHTFLLTGPRAVRSSIIELFETLAAKVSATSQVVIYFGGHGRRLENDSILCCYDTDPHDPGEAGLSGQQLDVLLSKLNVRGVLVILDCCRSAGFAEAAPLFFRNLQGAEFRILLSASRANQDSYESQDGTGTLFSKALLRVLSGETPAGTEAGLITFGGLVEALDFSIEEDRRAFYQNLPAQELVFAQVGSRDPILFFHRQLAAENLTVDTRRYSRRLILRKIYRYATFVICVGALALASHIVWLDGHQYGLVQYDRIQVFRGFPGLNAWGYPHLVWEQPLSVDERPQDRPLGPTGAIITDKREKPADLIFRLQGQLGQARILLELGDMAAAAKKLSALRIDHPSTTQSPAFLSLWSVVATTSDTDVLKQEMLSQTVDVRTNAALALHRLSPESVDVVLNGMYDLNAFDVRRFLQSIDPPCSAPVARFLTGPIVRARLQELSSVAIDTLIRLTCPIDRDAVILSAMRFPIRDLPNLAMLLSVHSAPPIRGAELYEIQLSDDKAKSALRAALLAAYSVPAGVCQTSDGQVRSEYDVNSIRANLMLASLFPNSYDRASFDKSLTQAYTVLAWAVNPNCREKLKVEVTDDVAILISLPNANVRMSEFMAEPEDAARLIRVALLAPKIQAALVLKHLLFRNSDPTVKYLAIRALLALGAMFPEDVEAEYSAGSGFHLLRSENADVRVAAMSWFVTTRSDEARSALANWLHDPDSEKVIKAFARLKPDESTLSLLRRAVNEPGNSATASALLTMLGTPDDAALELTRPEIARRSIALRFLAFRSDGVSVLHAIDKYAGPIPTWARKEAELIVAKRAAFDTEFATVQSPARLWWLDLVLEARGTGGGSSAFPPGLRLTAEILREQELMRSIQ